jgi:phosphoribosylanthranilate isomerase
VSVRTKICGLNDEATLDAAIEGGASMIGFNFYPPSPRAVTPARAAELAKRVPESVIKVALVVDADDLFLAEIVAALDPGLLQLHGREDRWRVDYIRRRFERPVMKVITVAGPQDVARAERYLGVADRLLFDTKAPKTLANALPGGNGLSFDWTLLAGRQWPIPWMLAGGLTPDMWPRPRGRPAPPRSTSRPASRTARASRTSR